MTGFTNPVTCKEMYSCGQCTFLSTTVVCPFCFINAIQTRDEFYAEVVIVFFHYYTCILGKIIKGPPNGLFHIWYIWSDLWRKSGKILKNGIRSLGRGSKMKHFPLKIFGFKIFIFNVFKNRHFCKIFKKICFIIFFDGWLLCYQ